MAVKKKLVIVESPTKAKTIRKFLDRTFLVESCMGHIRDLPQSSKEIPAKFKKLKWAQLGVDVDNHFKPLYLVPKEKQKVVKLLKEKLADVQELYLATDEDREGESISWHLIEVLEPQVPTRRMVFNEITKLAIEKSLKETRSIDLNLVKAQESRRILDRLVGYSISPLLWKKIAYGLSAGRVQSVAVRFLVEREYERMGFQSHHYSSVKVRLKGTEGELEARLTHWLHKKVVTSADFDSKTGEPKFEQGQSEILSPSDAQKIIDLLKSESFRVVELEEKPFHRKPMPPFITSTLQQEAARKLGWTARETMQVAQKLYEQGFITYMRTDSTFLSEEAIDACRLKIVEKYGKDFLPEAPRRYDQKKVKGAQEAHEAIRPAGKDFIDPDETGLSDREWKLYELIWKRTLASQMRDAVQNQTLVKIVAGDSQWSASGMTIDFPGFLRVYVEGTDDPEAELADRERRLPKLKKGEVLNFVDSLIEDHQTKPPMRFTEAGLVQMLEKEGIGRPSTYASILGTIVDRGYVRRVNNTLVPTITAFVVIDLLKNFLSPYVDVRFTSQMEESLDRIAEGELDSESYLRKIYFDNPYGLLPLIQEQEKKIVAEKARVVVFPRLAQYEFKVGRYGAYVIFRDEQGQQHSVTIPEDVSPSEITPEKIQEWIQAKKQGTNSLGNDPRTGKPIYLLSGRYGYFVQLGEFVEGDDDGDRKPKRVGLPSFLKPEDVDLSVALELLGLPKNLGNHPQKAKAVMVHLGRFGPYVSCDGEYRSIPRELNFLRITLNQAVELLSQEKGRGRGRQKKEVLKEIGPHPEDQKIVRVYSGPYGPYLNWGRVNVSLPKDLSLNTLSMEMAIQMIRQKQDSQKGSKRA